MLVAYGPCFSNKFQIGPFSFDILWGIFKVFFFFLNFSTFGRLLKCKFEHEQDLEFRVHVVLE